MDSSSTNAPSTPKRSRNLTRDQKLQVLTLYRAGNGQKYIADFLGITKAQVRYTVRSGQISPKKSKGATPKLNSSQVDELEKFVCSSHETRKMSYLELASNFPDWKVGEGAIKNALTKRGYSRCLEDKSSGNYVTRKSAATITKPVRSRVETLSQARDSHNIIGAYSVNNRT